MRIPFSGLHSWARTVLSRPSQRTSDHGLGKSPPTSPQGVPGGLELLHVSRELPDIQGVQAMSQDDSLFTSVKFGELRMGPSSETLQTPVRRTRGHIYNLLLSTGEKLSCELRAISTSIMFAVTVNSCAIPGGNDIKHSRAML